MNIRHYILAVTLLAWRTSHVQSQVTPYTNEAAWQSAAGTWSTIDFTGWPLGTMITDQYSHLGVHFIGTQPGAPASNSFIHSGWIAFPNDGWGITNTWANLTIHAQIIVEFDALQTHVACNGIGGLRLLLYHQNELIYTSMEFGANGFRGLVSTQPFDKVVIRREISDHSISIDNLYFSTPIPAPGALALLGLTALRVRARRRRT